MKTLFLELSLNQSHISLLLANFNLNYFAVINRNYEKNNFSPL